MMLVTEIIGGRKRRPIDLKEIWAYRELIVFLSARDIKVRYKQTILGFGWAIIQPVFTTLTFWFFLGKLAGIGSDGIPYALFAFMGVMPWTFFSNAVNTCGMSITSNAGLINKVYFPRMVVPISGIGAILVDVGISAVLLAVLMVYYRIAPSWNILLAPVLIAMTAVAALAIGLLVAALTVKYRDVRYALGFFLQLWMYATPIIYPLSGVPAKWRMVAMLNPLAGIVENFRACLVNRPLDYFSLGISIAIIAVLLLGSLYVFRQMEAEFADLA